MAQSIWAITSNNSDEASYFASKVAALATFNFQLQTLCHSFCDCNIDIFYYASSRCSPLLPSRCHLCFLVAFLPPDFFLLFPFQRAPGLGVDSQKLFQMKMTWWWSAKLYYKLICIMINVLPQMLGHWLIKHLRYVSIILFTASVYPSVCAQWAIEQFVLTPTNFIYPFQNFERNIEP